MKNIFDLTKREQRLVIMIVAALVTAALTKHFWENRAQLPPARASSAKAATAAGWTCTPTPFPTIQAEEERPEPHDSRWITSYLKRGCDRSDRLPPPGLCCL